MIRVLFLDIDGVLNSAAWNADHQQEIAQGILIDREKVQLLSQLVRDTHAQIILHSGWRMWFDAQLRPLRKETEILAQLFAEVGLSIAGVTPDLTTEDIRKNKQFSLVKADEILAWLGQHEDIHSWLVLDDLDLHNETIRQHQVQTDPAVGFTWKDVERACQILAK